MTIAKEMVGEMVESSENLPGCRQPHALDWNTERMGAAVYLPVMHVLHLEGNISGHSGHLLSAGIKRGKADPYPPPNFHF
jgi:hypothetical protein